MMINPEVKHALCEQIQLLKKETERIRHRLQKMDHFLERVDEISQEETPKKAETDEKEEQSQKKTKKSLEKMNEELTSDADLVRLLRNIAANKDYMRKLRQSYPGFVEAMFKITDSASHS
ncbi:hypothetical protein QR680_006365 [Steinernema hermaphroditum]|uniref:Uncharacterized protein n=1 Tax=Steinernema hermaphroditum TaxID=289476 RepID=A0AA39LX08_9BILA|nr:hypothetical protein QR680_006365 [Steinernema hermaphroditum]